jgi:nucleoside-diphosphate-sugar epimerase
MRVFITGASGFVGAAVVRELVDVGHQVVALARSDSSAAALRAAGLEVLRGALEDLDVLRAGAADSAGVIHLAFDHDVSKFAESARVEALALEALAAAIEGSERALVVSSGVLGLRTERDESPPFPRKAGMQTALAYATRGVRVSLVRNAPFVHGPGDTHGFVPRLIALARQKGVAGYAGDGTRRWPAVHRLDAARLYRLALEKAPAGASVHAVGEEGVSLRAIAEHIGRHLNLPVASIAPSEVAPHFGEFFAMMFNRGDSPSSSTITRQLLGWEPTHAGILDDIDEGHYFAAAR